MPTYEFPDGSKIDGLTIAEVAELAKALQPAPPSQAEIALDKLAALRTTVSVGAPATYDDDVDEDQIEAAISAAEEIKRNAAGDDKIVMPRHIDHPGLGKREKIRLPLTKNEMPVYYLLRNADREGISSLEISQRLGITHNAAQGLLTRNFSQMRGFRSAGRHRWTLEHWVSKCEPFENNRPGNNWPPPEGIPT